MISWDEFGTQVWIYYLLLKYMHTIILQWCWRFNLTRPRPLNFLLLIMIDCSWKLLYSQVCLINTIYIYIYILWRHYQGWPLWACMAGISSDVICTLPICRMLKNSYRSCGPTCRLRDTVAVRLPSASHRCMGSGWMGGKASHCTDMKPVVCLYCQLCCPFYFDIVYYSSDTAIQSKNLSQWSNSPPGCLTFLLLSIYTYICKIC